MIGKNLVHRRGIYTPQYSVVTLPEEHCTIDQPQQLLFSYNEFN